MNEINVIHHMNELRNIFSYASNIGFFFGAGTSCAFGLPSISELTKNVKEKLDPIQLERITGLEKAIIDLNGKTTITVEDLLNYIREIRALTNDRADYEFNGVTGEQAKELDQSICRLIFNNSKTVPQTETGNGKEHTEVLCMDRQSAFFMPSKNQTRLLSEIGRNKRFASV